MVSNKNKRNVIALLLLALCLFYGYKYIYQEHRNIETETPEFVINSKVLANEFSKNTIIAEKKYLNKTIQVFGLITEINKNDLILNHIVFCQFNKHISQSIKTKATIKIKGRCIGYDNLLEQVKLDQCTIIIN